MTSLADNAKLSAEEERFLPGLGQQLRVDASGAAPPPAPATRPPACPPPT